MEPDLRPCLPDMSSATVVVRGIDTAYVRAGSGPTVILLSEDESDNEPHLITELAQRFRLVLPNLPELPADCDAVQWLDGVLDGLGIEEAAILAEPRFLRSALALAGQQPDRVRGVALLAPVDPVRAADVSVALGYFFRDAT